MKFGIQSADMLNTPAKLRRRKEHKHAIAAQMYFGHWVKVATTLAGNAYQDLFIQCNQCKEMFVFA